MSNTWKNRYHWSGAWVSMAQQYMQCTLFSLRKPLICCYQLCSADKLKTSSWFIQTTPPHQQPWLLRLWNQFIQHMEAVSTNDVLRQLLHMCTSSGQFLYTFYILELNFKSIYTVSTLYNRRVCGSTCQLPIGN